MANTRTAFLNAPNAAEAARVIGKDGKAFRTYLRKLGVYASKGTGWQTLDAKQRADVLAHFTPNAPTQRKAKGSTAPVAE